MPRFCDPEPRYFFLLSVDSPELLPLPFSFSLLLSDRLIEATATFYLFTGSCGKDWNQHEWRAVPVLVCPLADSGGGENHRLIRRQLLFLCHILTQVQFGLLSPEEVVSTTSDDNQRHRHIRWYRRSIHGFDVGSTAHLRHLPSPDVIPCHNNSDSHKHSALGQP